MREKKTAKKMCMLVWKKKLIHIMSFYVSENINKSQIFWAKYRSILQSGILPIREKM